MYLQVESAEAQKGGTMYYIELTCKDGTVMMWDYDNRMDFERHLDNAVRVFDEKREIGSNLECIRMCICRLWIRVR